MSASHWPEVVRCQTPGCVYRAPADQVAAPWRCRDHQADRAADRAVAAAADDLEPHADALDLEDVPREHVSTYVKRGQGTRPAAPQPTEATS